jgi:tRNA nucleotidyltransferase/poly(A) polymerase
MILDQPAQPSLAKRVPEPLLGLAATLERAGHGAWLVGETAHDLLLGRAPERFAMVTTATPSELIAAFPTAVQTFAEGRCLLLPTPAGPVDLLPLPSGTSIEHALASRELSILALAWSLHDEKWIDPYQGLRDADDRRLRAAGDPRPRWLADPRSALRVIRFATCDGYSLDPALQDALAEVAPNCPVTRSPHGPRRELDRILLSEHAARGLELLRSTGLEAVIAPKVDADAPALVAAQPMVLALRLLAWLRGASAGRVLRQLRYPLNVSQRVLLLLQSHPLERSASAQKRVSVQRLTRRLDAQERGALAELRERELDALVARGRLSTAEANASRGELRALMEAALRLECEERAAREAAPLAMDGRRAMEIVGAGPGRWVGQALRHLKEQVLADPSLNSPERLEALLLSWHESTGTSVATRNEHGDIAPEPGPG